ncbi:MAG: hypothetical protein KAT15_29520, partial [Bacteroidales bacterium]|nr:hypothetical protein [Bacteroidales bacterium]
SVGLVNGLTAEEFAVASDTMGFEKEIQVAPLSNYLSSRVKREFKEGNTIVGGMFSLVNRISADSAILAMKPTSTVSGGVDLLHYWNNKNYYFEVKSIASQLQGSPEAMLRKQEEHTHRYQRPDAGYLAVDSLREQLTGHGGLVQIGKKGGILNFNLMGQYRSPGLNLNDMGYMRQADFVGQGAKISYKMNEPGNWIRNYTIELGQEAQWSFGGENTHNKAGAAFTLMNNKLWRFYVSYHYDFTHLDIRELRGGPAFRIDGEHQIGAYTTTNGAKDLSGNVGFHYNVYGETGAHQEVFYAGITWLPIRKLKLSGKASFNNRKYHQQYVITLQGSDEPLYVVGHIDHRTASFTFRGELFLTPELSLQYYGSPYYAVGAYDDFNRVDQSRSKDISGRLEPLDVTYNSTENSYSFDHSSETWNFGNPDFSFMQFRSNLVFRWEYKLGSTLYLVWAHDRSGWES